MFSKKKRKTLWLNHLVVKDRGGLLVGLQCSDVALHGLTWSMMADTRAWQRLSTVGYQQTEGTVVIFRVLKII